MTKLIKLSENFTLGDLLEFIFYNADTKKVNFCVNLIYDAFYQLKSKYPKEFSEFFFYRTGNNYHSRELEMYISDFATWRILDIPSNGCELKFFWDESKNSIARKYQKSNPEIKLRIEEITDSLIESYKQVLAKFNNHWHSHSLK